MTREQSNEYIKLAVLYDLPLVRRPYSRAQRLAFKRLYLRAIDRGQCDVPMTCSYKEFRRTVQYTYDGCAMVNLWGMWLGIERDGYTHS